MSTTKTNEQTDADIQAVDEMFAAFGRNGDFSFKAEKTKPVVAPQIPVQIKTTQTVHPIEQPKLRTLFEEDKDDSDNTWVTWSCRAVIVCSCVLIAYILLTGSSWSPLRNHSVAQPIRDLLPPSTHQIEAIEVGMRVAGTNPDRSQVEVAPEPNPETSRKLMLRMKKESGRNLFITLLRPVKWIEASDIIKGSTFHLDLPEMGAVGDAYVEAILPCPPINQGKGNVVTGTFAHEADPDKKILRVEFSDGAVIKGVTDNHPFWSVDRNDFVPVGEMKEGERVKANSGVIQITKIDSRNARAGEMLYNLETHNEHVYQVTLAGVMVHNSCYDDITDLPIVGKSQAGAARPPRHHVFPQQHRQWFKDRGFDIDRVTVQLDQGTHSALHSMGWNDKIMGRLIAREAQLGRKLTSREIWEIGYRKMRIDGIADLPILPFND